MWDRLYRTLRPLFQAPEQILFHIDEGVSVLDIGCGYGDLCAQIAERKHAPSILGIDHDTRKIDVARTRHAHVPNLRFEAADLQSLSRIDQHTVLIIDVLHYFDRTAQTALLNTLVQSPSVQKIIVRDALRSPHPGYALTRVHEWIMTRINRTKVSQTHFTFLTRSQWRQTAHALNLHIAFEKAGLPFYNDHLILFTRPQAHA